MRLTISNYLALVRQILGWVVKEVAKLKSFPFLRAFTQFMTTLSANEAPSLLIQLAHELLIMSNPFDKEMESLMVCRRVLSLLSFWDHSRRKKIGRSHPKWWRSRKIGVARIARGEGRLRKSLRPNIARLRRGAVIAFINGRSGWRH